METSVDVIVIGSGPTGLLLAAELARYGLSCKIVDKGSSWGDTSRAVAIQARTLELFSMIEIADQFLAQGTKIQAAHMVSGGKTLARFSFDHLDSPYPFVLSLEQSKTEALLKEHLCSLGAEVEKGWEFISCYQEENEVRATIENLKTKEKQTIKAFFLVGCDGAHSEVRKELNLSFHGEAFSDVFSLADIHVDWKYPHNEFLLFLSSQGILAAIPLPEENRYRLIFQLPRCRDLLHNGEVVPSGLLDAHTVEPPTLEEVTKLIEKYGDSDAKVTDPLCMNNFHIHSRMASSYRQGRIFLAGDAAHIHSPAGGQGMNTGLQDAINLAWKIAYVHKKWAKKELLDTYDIERRWIGENLLKGTKRGTKIASLHLKPLVFCRNQLIKGLAKIPIFQRFLPRVISQIGLRYPTSMIVSKGSLTGLRAPNANFSGEKDQSDLYSLWKDTKVFYLLLFCGEKKDDHWKLAKKFASPNLVPVIISYGPGRSEHGIHFIYDPNGDTHRAYKAKNASAYVVRPDLYIGYAGPANENALMSYFKRIFYEHEH